MKNELGRKITSLTIMTIMVAGGLTLAAPGVMPEAEAQTNHLYVSAVNAESNNTFGGPQVIEIIVSDPARTSLELSASTTGSAIGGVPDVEVNGDNVAMVQAQDGNWYAYIGDDTNISDADGLGSDYNLDFGIQCTTSALAVTATGIDEGGLEDISSVWVSSDACSAGSTDVTTYDLVRAAPSIFNSPGATDYQGGNQIEAAEAVTWPFIQTYVLDKYDDFDVCYLNGSATECVSLTYDSTENYAYVAADRDVYPPGAQVELDIFDPMLNLDPTAVDIWTFDFSANTPSYGEFTDGSATATDATDLSAANLTTLGFDDNGVFKMTENSVLDVQNNGDFTAQDTATDISFIESSWNTSHFINIDDDDKTNLIITSSASRGTVGTIDYNDSAQSILVGYSTGSLVLDTDAVGEEWTSGEELPVTFYDQDLNLNNSSDEDLQVNGDYEAVPTITMGSPGFITSDFGSPWITVGQAATGSSTTLTIDSSSHIASHDGATTAVADGGTIAEGVEIGTGIIATDFVTMLKTIDTNADDILSTETRGEVYIGYDLRQLKVDVCGADSDPIATAGLGADNINLGIRDADSDPLGDTSGILENVAQQGVIAISDLFSADVDTYDDGEIVVEMHCRTTYGQTDSSIATDVSFFVDFYALASGVNHSVYRIEAEESGDSTGEFVGSIEYIMMNQNTEDQVSDWPSRTHQSDEVVMLLTGDLTGVDAPRVKVSDTDSDGVSTPQAVQMDALTHSATVSFDAESYKVADTVTVTVNDMDINTDSELIEVYTIAAGTDLVEDGDSTNVSDGASFSHILEITFDDETWEANACTQVSGSVDDFAQTGFTLVETDVASGVFVGTFQVPDEYCSDQSTDEFRTTTGKDMEANYIDFYDESSNTIEVGAGAAITANTGSITLDRDVYPIPFDASVTTNANYAFLDQAGGAQSTHTGSNDGDVWIYAWIDDADYDQSPTGEDKINSSAGNSNVTLDSGDTACTECGPVVVKVFRGADYQIVLTAGNDKITTNTINADADGTGVSTNEHGPLYETDDDTGVFELMFSLGHDKGPGVDGTQQVIKQGDVLTVEYTDPTDASGDSTYLATDSATFDLRTGVLTSDKSVYVIGQDVILSIIDDDLNLDSDSTETYGLDLVEWDSDAAEVLLDSTSAFDPEPNGFRETGSNTGVFQTVIEFPSTLSSTVLDRGEVVDLEYVDYGPSGADFYNDDTEDIGLTISSSNFGATIELDQKVYSWAERVFITITAPDHNFDSALVDEIGNTSSDPITVATRDTKLTTYKLLETGEDTGIFYGEVTLNGFAHDSDGDATTGNSSGNDKTCTSSSGTGPTGGLLCAQDEDGITVSFEYTEDSTVIGSALIRWNIGEATWLDSSYSAAGSGTVRIVDPDMDLNADYVDNFKVDVWSDSDSGGIDLTVTETSEMSGVFEGSVFFTTTDESSGHRLRVSEGDTVTVEYEDNTLPNPYNQADELEVAGTAIIGTITPPLERAPAANARVVDAFGNSLDEVSVDQQVQIEADLVNGTDADQSFAYLVQVQDGNGVTVSLAWITGSLAGGQSFSPALSWIPSEAGSYEATVFVWESVDNPSALSDTVSVSIDVV